MTCRGIIDSTVFTFNENVDFVKFSAMRFMGCGDEAVLKELVITSNEYQLIGGVKIPTKMKASWKLNDGHFT